MSVTNLQQKIHFRQSATYNLKMFDADKFAERLNEHFRLSPFKSFSELGTVAKLSRSTISAFANAKKQTLTDKPSQPKKENVLALAAALKWDAEEALNLAGYASENTLILSEAEKRVIAKFSKLTPKNQATIESLMDQLLDKLTEPNMQFPAKIYRQAPLEEENDEVQTMRT